MTGCQLALGKIPYFIEAMTGNLSTNIHLVTRLCCYSLCDIIPDYLPCLPDARGGVPGGVLDGELVLSSDSICKGGMQAKQTLLGQGPKFVLPQLSQGGVVGGDHEDELLPG